MSKVVLIGIDGFDPVLVERWLDGLPNLARIKQEGVLSKIQSTFPPDSICAWVSIFTGKNPAEHGLLESVDYLSRKKYKYADGYNFNNATFWDELTKCGKKVCIINPFLAYPAWPVNGMMVSGPVFEGGKITAYPEGILERYDFPLLGGWVDFPDEKDLAEFFKKAYNHSERLAQAALRLYIDERPDLFFLTFLTADRVQHFLWRFMEQGKGGLKDCIYRLYILFDRIIGEFMQVMDEDSIFVLISDHGHGRRSRKCLNINEMLRREGYLKISGSKAEAMGKRAIERLKVGALKGVHRFGLQDWMYRIAKFIPQRKALRKASYLVDKQASLAYASEFCSTNPFGGIQVRPGDNYERTRDGIIVLLRGLKNGLKQDIVLWAKKKEELYNGRYISRFPDIVFRLDDDYGVNWDLFASLICDNYTYRKISGGHRQEGVIGMYAKSGIGDVKRSVSILEIKDLVLGLLEKY